MSPFTGGNSDLIIQLASLVDMCGIFFLHSHRTAAASDIARQCKKLLHMDHFDLFIPGSLCCFFQIQFKTHGNTENMDTGAVAPGDQRFEYLFFRQAYCCSSMGTAQIILIVSIECFPAGYFCLLDQTNSVCFCCHKITLPIIRHPVNKRKVNVSEKKGNANKKSRRHNMNDQTNPDMRKQEREQVVELGSDITKSSKGNIYTLTIIGQVEGHQVAPETVKTTKYEHVLPLLAGIEESDEIDGLLLLLNTVGGDIEAGLAIAEMIAGMKKPTVSLVLGGGHSIGIPLAVCTKKSFITPTASMTVHPVRMTGLVVGAPQTFRYFQRIQEQIADFVTSNSRISRADFEHYMMATGEMATDVGTILYGKEAVSSGLIDKLGGLNDALAALHKMIDRNASNKQGNGEKSVRKS